MDSSSPRLGIGIATRDRLPILKEGLAAVARFTRAPACVVVADDGSTDGTVEYLRARDLAHVAGRQHGAAWNRNRLLHALFVERRCDVAILLDDDVHPTEPGWEAAWLRGAEGVGMVAYGYTLPEGTRGVTPRAETGGGCIALTRETFEVVGYFDPRYQGKGYEDADYFRRAWPFSFPYVPGLNCSIRHLAAPGNVLPGALEANRALFEGKPLAAPVPFWRCAAECWEFLCEQEPVWRD